MSIVTHYGTVEKRLKEIVLETCIKYRAQIIEIEVMPDHVHLLVEVNPQFGIAKLIMLLKCVSSSKLRKEFPGLCQQMPALWTNSYFVSTVGGAPLEVIKQYVQNQKNPELR